jgi:hypothetical protein
MQRADESDAAIAMASRIDGHAESRGLGSARRAYACRRRPGKTVDGRDVAPADLDDGQRPQLPETIPILITSELQDFYHVPFSSPLFEADALIGVVSYDRATRRFTFNGVELGDPEQRLLAAQCRAAMAQPPAP